MQISDEEKLKNENITLDSSIKEFNINKQKAINFKENIEKEINLIDDSYQKIYNEITKSFQAKHELLIKEENDLIEKLQNEVTKVKEKLELVLSKSNNIVKSNERVDKGIKIIEKNKDNNITQILSYISKINKNKKEINNLYGTLIKNLKITYNEESKIINFDEYYFNGLQIPKDIEFKNITNNSLGIIWKIDNINILNIEQKNIKFNVEIRKKNSKKKYITVYKGNKNNCFIGNLKKNTNYEIRICSIYNNLLGNWSEIQNVKTLQIYYDYDSDILNGSEKKIEFLKKIFEWTGCTKMQLLYRGTRDGSTSDIFHKKCDNKGPTICLYKNNKGNIFGGYSSISWTNSGNSRSAPDSFIFTLSNIYGIQPTKFINKEVNKSVYHNSNNGPSFYDDIWVQKDFKDSKSLTYFTFPRAYKDSLGKGKSLFTGDTNNNYQDCIITEIEVFKIF